MKEKGVDKGTDVGGPTLPKIGLKLLIVVGRAELEDTVVVTLEGLHGKRPSLSLVSGAMKMGWNRGYAKETAGAAEDKG